MVIFSSVDVQPLFWVLPLSGDLVAIRRVFLFKVVYRYGSAGYMDELIAENLNFGFLSRVVDGDTIRVIRLRRWTMINFIIKLELAFNGSVWYCRKKEIPWVFVNKKFFFPFSSCPPFFFLKLSFLDWRWGCLWFEWNCLRDNSEVGRLVL